MLGISAGSGGVGRGRNGGRSGDGGGKGEREMASSSLGLCTEKDGCTTGCEITTHKLTERRKIIVSACTNTYDKVSQPEQFTSILAHFVYTFQD